MNKPAIVPALMQTRRLRHNSSLLGSWYACLLLLSLVGGVILPVVLGVPVVQAQTAVPDAVRQAYTLLDRGLVNDAIASFRSFLQRHPQSVAAKLGLAIGYQRAGKDAEAWTTYQQVVAQDPNNQPALRAIGLLGGYRPEWQAQGIEALTTLLKLKPNETAARAQRALLLGYQGRFAEALTDYQLVLSHQPTPDVVLGAAQIYTYSGDYKGGIELFNRYRATGKSIPSNAVTAYALALRETGSTTQAVKILKAKLQQAKPDEAIEIESALSEAYEANGQLPEALAALKPLRGKKDATLALARSLSQIGHRAKRADIYTEAIALYRQVLKQTPHATFALKREVADVLSESPPDQADALQMYQELTQLQPDNKGVLVKQLALSHQLNIISQTDLEQRLTQLLQPLPTAPSEQRAIALALLPLDPPDPELLPVYQSLLTAGVDVPLLNFRVAEIFVQRHQFAEAKQALANYIATPVGSQDLAPELLLAEIDRRQGNLEASAARYQAIIQRQGAANDVVDGALQGLVSIRLDQNRPDDAIALYDQLLVRNPQDLRPALARASVAYKAKRISLFQAQAVLDQWLQTQPSTSTPPVLFDLVSTLPPDAERLELYNNLLKFDPNSLPIQLRLVQVLAVQDPATAKKRIADLLVRDPDNIGAYFAQGEAAQGLGDLQLASHAYEEILARQPKNTDALSALAGVHFQQRQYAAAAALYHQVLDLKPQDQVALSSLAELSLVQDRPLEALRQLNQLQQVQATAGTSDDGLNDRIQRLRVNLLKRRSFQPSWERY